MIHNRATYGYWGVSHNGQKGIIILTGNDENEEQARCVLTVDQARRVANEIERMIQVVKGQQHTN